MIVNISISENGEITILDPQLGDIKINTNDPRDSKKKLSQLDASQLASLNIIADKSNSNLSEKFIGLLRQKISQKNIIQGDISNVASVKIGDEIHYHYHTGKHTLAKELTAKIPILSQDKIIGRDTEIRDLHERLFHNNQIVLLYGFGGIGKSTVAQVYMTQYWDDYQHIVWIDQSTDDIIRDFISTEGLLESLNISRDDRKPKELFIRIISELKKIDTKPNLLIVDNADNSLSKLYDYLPNQPQWHVLATSREKINEFDLKQLGFLTETEAITLFKSHYTHYEINIEEIKELVKMVDMHTLTIEILAKTAQLQRIDITTLRRAIEDDIKAKVYIKHADDRIENVTSYLSTIFTLSDLNENEVWLLTQIACLPGKFLNYKLLKDLISPEAHPKEEIFSETIENLSEKGWLLKNKETDSYKLHGIILSVIKKQQSLAPEVIEPLIYRLISELKIDQTKDNPVDKFKWISFGNSVLKFFPNNTDLSFAKLKHNLASVLQAFGDYERARNLLMEALQSYETHLGYENPNVYVVYSSLGIVLQDLGDYKGAKKIKKRVLRFNREYFGENHPETAKIYTSLGDVLQDLGDFKKAKKKLIKAKIINEKHFGEEHLFTAASYTNLGLAHHGLGELEEAEDLLKKSMNIHEKELGSEHPDTATNYSNYAAVIRDLGDLPGARKFLEKALHSDLKNFGIEHPNTVSRYWNLAQLLEDVGDLPNAKDLIEKVVELDEKIYGLDHPYTMKSHCKLVYILQKLNDFPKAKELLIKIKEVKEKRFGDDHVKTARTYSELGNVFFTLKDYKEAKNMHEKALDITEKNFGEKHKNTETCKTNLAGVLHFLGENKRAKSMMKKVVTSNEKNLGPEHLDTASNYLKLAKILHSLGEKDALEYAIKAVDILEKKLPKGHPEIEIAKRILDDIKK